MSAAKFNSLVSLLPLAVVFLGVLPSLEPGLGAEPPITSIVFAPDGDSVLVGSQIGIVERDWPTLKPVRQIPTKVGNLHDLAFSPNGRRLGIAGGTPAEEGLIEVVSWPELELQHRLREHSDSVMAIDWIDDSTIASASLDHQIVIQDVQSDSPAIQLSGHSKGVTALCLIRGKNRLVSAGLDQNLRVWDLGSHELIRSLNNHTLPVHSLALRPGGHPLAMVASVSDDKTVRLWQPSIGRMVRFVRLPAVALDVAWLMDGSAIVVSCDDGRIRMIDPDTVELRYDLPAIDGWAYTLAVHPDDHSLLVGGSDGQLKRVEVPAAASVK